MKRFTTILCSLAFFLSGIIMATSQNKEITTTGFKTISAATPMYPTFYTKSNTNAVDLPKDVKYDLLNSKNITDTVFVPKTDTVYKQVTKVKYKKSVVSPPTMEITVTAAPNRDTIRVPVYYVAMQRGNKTDSEEHVPIYELKQVDELCSKYKNLLIDSIH